MANVVRIIAASVLLLAPAFRAEAQENPPAADPLGRSTPRSLLINFLRVAHHQNYATAAEYLQVGGAPGSPNSRTAQELARKLQAVLDHSFRIDLSNISENPEGRLDDGLAADIEKLGALDTTEGPIDVTLVRVRKGATPIWLFSAETLRQVPAAYENLAPNAIENYVPDVLKRNELGGIAMWRWLALLLLIPIAFGLAWAISRLLVSIANRFATRTSMAVDDTIIRIIKGPLHLFIAVAVFHSGMMMLELPFLLRQGLSRLEMVLAVAAVTWFVLRLIDVAGRRMIATLVKTGRAGATSVVPLGRRILKIVAVFLACIAVLDNAGFDLRTILTGLGIGGIAIALAAQKTLENLFGGISIVMDQPIRVGDFCRFGDNIGTVMDIGLRSTRIRTLERTIISVPNSSFSGMNIENFGPREKIWFHPILKLRIDTSPHQLRQVLADVRSLLEDNPMIEGSGRVRLIGAAADGFSLEVFAYVLTPNIDEFLGIQEELLLRMLEIVEAAGTSLAVPAQLNISSDGFEPEDRRTPIARQ